MWVKKQKTSAYKGTGFVIIMSGPLGRKSPPSLSLGRTKAKEAKQQNPQYSRTHLFIQEFTFTAHVVCVRHSARHRMHKGKPDHVYEFKHFSRAVLEKCTSLYGRTGVGS